jgi:ElaB/YqjD/DUF883 family membrane-anchored ribosome-binding protein
MIDAFGTMQGADTEMDENTEVTDETTEAQNPVRRKLGNALTVAREKTGEIIADTREKSFRAADETNRIFQEHPIAAVAAAAAAGAVFAIFAPKLFAASRAGAAANKVGQVAKQAARSKVARNAAQIVLAGVSRTDGVVGQAVSKATQAVTDRVRATRSKKPHGE